MIQHNNGKFICGGRVAFKLPNNVFLDFNPPVIPNEGMIFYSEDLKVTIDVDFLETERDARTFLREAAEDFETFRIVRDIQPVHMGELKGYGMVYALTDEICEEYALTLPGAEPALFTVCLAQHLDDLADAEIYVKLRDELLAGIERFERAL